MPDVTPGTVATVSDLVSAGQALAQATRDVADAFARCAAYLDADAPAAVPLKDWTSYHFTLLLTGLSGSDTPEGRMIQQLIDAYPSVILPITAAVARFGYALAEQERA